MRKFYAVMAIGCASLIALAGCSGGDNRVSNSLDDLKEIYGFQWEDTTKPILNEKGAEELEFHIYSSKNSSAKDYNDMEIMQTLYEQTNVFVNWENVSESIYGQQKILMMGNHTGYDAIYHAGMTPSELITYGSRSHDLLAINEYLEYMPNFSAILKARPDIRKSITNADGNIYALPRIEEMGLLQNPNLLFLNKAWTEEVIEKGAVTGITKDQVKDGLKLTSDQMEKILTYFKEHDMNGNGEDDERPLSFVYNNWQGNQFDLYGMFGINDNIEHRIIKEGKVTYTVLDEKYMKATNFIHDWLSKELIDPVSLTQTQNEFLTNGKQTEKYGAFYWWESKTVVDHPENYVCCQPLVGPEGDQTVSVSNNPEVSTGELVFFSDAPNVEVLLAYFDRYYDPEISAQINYGPIGIAFEEEKDANGKLVAKDPPAGKTADDLRLENAPLGICYLSDDAWENVVNMEERAQLRLERLALCATPFYDHDRIQPTPNLPFTSAEIGVFTAKETGLNTALRTNLLNFLRNGVSESEWNSFINKLNGPSVGLQDVQKAYQSAYDRYIGK